MCRLAQPKNSSPMSSTFCMNHFLCDLDHFPRHPSHNSGFGPPQNRGGELPKFILPLFPNVWKFHQAKRSDARSWGTLTQQQVDAQGSGGCFVMGLAGVVEKATGSHEHRAGVSKLNQAEAFPMNLQSLFIPSYIKHQEQSGHAQRRRNFRRASPLPCPSDRQQRWEGWSSGDAAGTKQEGGSQKLSCAVLLLLLFKIKQTMSRPIQ